MYPWRDKYPAMQRNGPLPQVMYLGCTKDLWFTFGGRTTSLVEGYCDADWASQKHRHSISGYSFHLGNGAMSWSSKKQYIIVLSSTEAEYITQTHAAKEALWLQAFLWEIQGLCTGPLNINCDNQGAIALAKDNKFHARTKHLLPLHSQSCRGREDISQIHTHK